MRNKKEMVGLTYSSFYISRGLKRQLELDIRELRVQRCTINSCHKNETIKTNLC